ncbi:MAG: hypothetical protein K0S16_2080, partial [Moraxellaceae bacterium]|nr:hypothetical protein [Moraxellaceae bacterium]
MQPGDVPAAVNDTEDVWGLPSSVACA